MRPIICDNCGKPLPPRKPINVVWYCLDCVKILFPKTPTGNGDIKVTKP